MLPRMCVGSCVRERWSARVDPSSSFTARMRGSHAWTGCGGLLSLPPLFPVLVRSDLSKRERNPQIWWKALQQMHQEKGDLLFRFASFPLFVFFPFELYQREKVYPKLTPTHILCFPLLSLVCMSAYVRGVCLCVLVRFFFFFILLCLVSFAFSSFLSASFSFFFRSIPFFVLLLPLRARVHVC